MLTSDQDLDASSNRQVITSPSLQYPTIVTELSIEQSKVMPIFSEATAMAIRLTKAPVAILMATGKLGCQIGSISGLDQFRQLPPQPNLLLELAGLEYCYAQVMSGESRFSIADCLRHPQLAQFPLFRMHGVQSYLGVPIVTAAKDRLGTIAILDFTPHQFTDRDVDLLQVVSRLVASEFERKLLSQEQLNRSIHQLQSHHLPGFDDAVAAAEYGHSMSSISADEEYNLELEPIPSSSSSPKQNDQYHSSVYPQVQGEIQFKLLTYLAQELRTPLTSILGMASVLQQEVYGSLSIKQKDYLGIIHQSGQQLVSIVDEISQLSEFDPPKYQLLPAQSPTLRLVDLEMLCQLALQSLEPLAQKKNQQLVLDITVGRSGAEQILSIGKDKVRQIVYYLSLSLIYASAVDTQILIRLVNSVVGGASSPNETLLQRQTLRERERNENRLQLQITTTDPLVILQNLDLDRDLESVILPSSEPDQSYPQQPNIAPDLRVSLGLSLSYSLATSQSGKIDLMPDLRGYQLTLPISEK